MQSGSPVPEAVGRSDAAGRTGPHPGAVGCIPADRTLTAHVNDSGELVFVWEDDLHFFQDIGEMVIARASHVEPNRSGEWSADLSPVNGPTLGPFKLRGEALAAERAWLDEHL